MGLLAVRQYAVEDPAPREGTCEPVETGPKHLMETGCASTDEFPDEEAFPTFTATASDERLLVPKIANRIAVTTCAASQISQADADRKAACFAQGQINALILRMEALDTLTFAEGCTTLEIDGPTALLAVYFEDGVTPVDELIFATLLSGQIQSLTLILKNIGNAVLNVNLLTIFGDNPDGFTVTAEPGLVFLEPDETTTVVLRALVV